MTAVATVGRAHGRFRLCVWCAAAVLAEIGLYLSYRGHDSRFHWLTHFFVGASVALLVMAAVAWRRGRPVPYPLVWPLLGHLVAMAPDLLFTAGVVHERWMDLFLGHISTHFVWGQNRTWYGTFLVALAIYLATLDHIRTRRRR